MPSHIVYIGLGSNLGDGPKNLDTAIGYLQREAGEVLFTADYIESEPWGFESEHGFTNSVTVIRTTLEPLELLDVTQQIERQMGRTHKHKLGESYQDRIIDLDLLLFDDLQLQTPRLTLPHPLIEKRDFVQLPLQQCREAIKQLIIINELDNN